MKINDLNPYPLGTAPATGPAGNIFMDPAFQTPILRVTDQNDAAGVGFANGYSSIWDTFNLDSTHFGYGGFNGSGWLADLDCTAKKVTNKRQPGKLASNNPAYWSRLNPDVLYLIETWQAANLWRYQVSTNTWELIADLSKLLGPQPPNTAWCGSRGMSWDDNRFHIAALGNQYIYDVKQAKLIGPYTLAMALATGWATGVDPATQQANFNKSTMDSAGYLLYTADNDRFIYNVETGVGVFLDAVFDSHCDTGLNNQIAGAGGGTATTPDNSGFYPFVTTLDPSNPGSLALHRKILGPRFLWGLDSHTSYRDKTGEWVTFNLDGTIIGADVGKVPIFGNQDIFQLSVHSPADGSINRRICQSYSNPNDFDPSLWYEVQPHASAAPDNRAIAFSSSYGNKRIDLYIAFLEDAPAVPVTGQLAGVNFTADEAQLLKTFAQYQLSLSQKR